MSVYLDNAATTPVDPRIADLVLRLMSEEYGNAGSRTHEYGLAASRQVALARERVGKLVAAGPDEIVFTSGATESDNLATLGLAAHGVASVRRHIVSTTIEHKAVLEPLRRLAGLGFDVDLVEPDALGYVNAQDVLDRVRPDTLLVSVMHANNETGAVQPIGAIAAGLPDSVLMHVDAAQTFGRLDAQLADPRIDLISVSGHKVFAPKGVGALVVRRRGGVRPPLEPLMLGGDQERGLRPGTQPVALIAGFGLAAEIAAQERDARASACRRLRAEALAALAPLSPRVLGDEARGVLPHILSLSVPGVDSEAVMVALKGLVAISNGSACTSARYEPSHVLTAMRLPNEEAAGVVRISWSHATPPVPWTEMAARLEDLRI